MEDNSEHGYVYIFIREDISHPQRTVQSVHAAIEAASAFDYSSLNDHPSVIVLCVKNEQKLHRAKRFLNDQNIRHVHFNEPDFGGEMTSLATEPLFGEQRHPLSKYPLLKEDQVLVGGAL